MQLNVDSNVWKFASRKMLWIASIFAIYYFCAALFQECITNFPFFCVLQKTSVAAHAEILSELFYIRRKFLITRNNTIQFLILFINLFLINK